MRVIIVFLTLLCATPAHAQTSFWNHNGSQVELISDGSIRTLQYWQPRPGLPVTVGTLLFRGTASGNRYSGTAYVFSRVCGAIGYSVSGIVESGRKSITLYGRAPRVDSSCNVVAYRDDVLAFSFSGCGGCECGNEAELIAIFPPPPANYPETTSAQDAASCPYLYAWNEGESRWHSYGKVIRDARGPSLEMTESIKLSTVATRFRLSEEEPEHSFIDHVELRLELKDGSQIVVKPKTKILAKRDKKRLYIPAFRSVEFVFKLPDWVEPANVEQASLSITGYYESLPRPAICRAPNAVSGK